MEPYRFLDAPYFFFHPLVWPDASRLVTTQSVVAHCTQREQQSATRNHSSAHPVRDVYCASHLTRALNAAEAPSEMAAEKQYLHRTQTRANKGTRLDEAKTTCFPHNACPHFPAIAYLSSVPRDSQGDQRRHHYTDTT